MVYDMPVKTDNSAKVIIDNLSKCEIEKSFVLPSAVGIGAPLIHFSSECYSTIENFIILDWERFFDNHKINSNPSNIAKDFSHIDD